MPAGKDDIKEIQRADLIEEFRLQALKEYQVLDTEPEMEFDSITRLAAYICKTPISLVSLVDEERQWFKSRLGLDTAQTPRNISFCRYTIQDDAILEVKDASCDDRFADTPLVTGFPNIRYYAGAPLITPEGHRLGSLCVIDTKPNEIDDEQKDALRTLAKEVISHLEVAKKNRQLKETLLKYRDIYTMFDTSGELHCILDDQTRIHLISKSVKNILGYSVEEAIGKSIASFCLEEDRRKILEVIEPGLRRGEKNFELETRIRTKSGEMKWISWSVAVKDRRWFTNGRDITYQKQVVAEFELLSLVASKVDNGVIISDANNEVIWANEAFERITGFNINDLKGRKLGDILKGEGTDEKIIAEAREHTRNKQSFAVDILAYRKDGQPIWLSIMNSVILNADGTLNKEIEIIVDITARKEAEQQLNILSLASTKSSSGVLVRSSTGAILWMNEALEQIWGYTLAELEGKTFGEILIGEETDLNILQEAKDAVARRQPYEIEIKVYRKDKTPVWVFISNNPIFNAEGEVERQVGVVVDISERKKSEEQLRLLSLVASKTVNGVIINNKNGCVTWVNDAFTDITGYELHDVKDKRIGNVLKGPDTDLEELERIRALSANRHSFNAELLNYRKDGKPVWLSVSNTPIFNKDGSLEQEIEIVNDISERKKAEEELIKTREEALQLSKAKEMFLSVMSHEIRTPLNAVIGMTHILLSEDPKDSQLENLNILKFSSENLLSLLNDILDFTKIETGNLQLENIDFNIKELVAHTMTSLQFRTAEKGIVLRSEIDHRIPDQVKGDHIRLYQIMINLLGNSIKFTESGEVKLSLTLAGEDEKGISICFEVSDTGIGIPADKLADIFVAYKQAKSDTSRKYGGTGLGLAITSRLIQLHNSEIQVSSEEGAGSCFTFTIRFQRAKPSVMITENNSVYRDLSSAHILVVDDNDINRLLAKKVLGKWGIVTDFAVNGQEAIDSMLKERYDLVLMDINMPVMGGFEAVKHIRQMNDVYYKNVPIIALTASIMSSDLIEIKESGMNDYVLKPFSPDDLYTKINAFL